MLKIKLGGFDEVRRSLDQLAQNAQQMDGRHEVGFDELFVPGFMRANTKYGTFEALLEASPYAEEAKADFSSIPDEPWDQFIREATNFDSWQAMIDAAVSEYTDRKLFDGV